MKKLSIFLAVMFLLSSFALTVSAAESFDIPKAAAAPTFDGVVNEAEWKGALKYTMSSTEREFGYNQPEAGTFTNSALYFMWDDKNLYVAAVIDDPTKSDVVPSSTSDTGNFYKTDGIHFQVYAKDAETSSNFKLPNAFWIGMLPRTADGAGLIYVDHVIDGSIIATEELGAKIASKMTSESSYVMEIALPWAIFETATGEGWNADINGKAGQAMKIESIIWEVNGTANAKRFVAGQFRRASDADVFTLSDKVAGGAASSDTTAAVTTAATTTAATTTAATTTAATTTAAGTSAAPDTNPPTDDPAATTVDAFIVTSAVLALAACGGIAVSKKRK